MKTRTWLLLCIGWLGCVVLPLRGQAAAGATDDLFEPVKLLMTKVEIEIYEHLADDKARDEFIADFWKKRDPSPLSEENEFKDDFDKRVEFANRWFQESGRAGSGWDSDRGRVLVMLGFPDQREQMPMIENPRIKAAEVWIYSNYSLRLVFIDYEGFGRFRLDRWPLELLDAIDLVKELGMPAVKKNYFRFKAHSGAAGVRIEIPLRTVIMEERGDELRAAFTVTVDVYRDYVKLERLSLTREFIESRAAFMARKSIAIDVPYAYPRAGKYFLDVIVEEMVTGQRYRDFVRFKASGKG